MVEITQGLLDDEFLRARFVPAMADSLDTQESSWGVTIRCNGELVGHRTPSPFASDPSIILTDDTLSAFKEHLAEIDADFTPRSTADGFEYRFLTYRVENRIRNITYVSGISDDFGKQSQFDRIWDLLAKLSTDAGF